MFVCSHLGRSVLQAKCICDATTTTGCHLQGPVSRGWEPYFDLCFVIVPFPKLTEKSIVSAKKKFREVKKNRDTLLVRPP